MRTLLYIGQAPAEGTGSPVIVLRHLQRLAATGDWQIVIVAEAGQDTSACAAAGWHVHTLPSHRRWWWPPYRKGSSELARSIRARLLAKEVKSITQATPPDAVFAYLAAHADFSAEIASHVAQQTGAPLSLLIHDDATAFAKSAEEKQRLRRRHARILYRAHRNWFVSPELAGVYDSPSSAAGVLYPIPEGGARAPRWREIFSVRPRIYYAGHLWPAQFPLLGKLAAAIESASARLVIMSRDTPELRNFLAAHPADWQPPFTSNREALAHLEENATAMLVSYTDTIAEMPWVATSFPSKFIEYTHLGLPTAIIAPTDSSIGRWVSRENFPYFYTYETSTGFTAWLASLRNPITWAADAAPMHRLATTIFDPARIQLQWEGSLLKERSKQTA